MAVRYCTLCVWESTASHGNTWRTPRTGVCTRSAFSPIRRRHVSVMPMTSTTQVTILRNIPVWVCVVNDSRPARNSAPEVTPR